MFEARNLPPAVAVEYKGCPNGCKLNDELLFYAKDRFHNLPGEFPLVRCKTCNLVRTNPRPTLDSLAFYYPDDYAPYQGTKVEGNINMPRPSLGYRILRKIFDSKTKAIPPLPPGKMLEVGCASGSFLHEMAFKGWDVYGIEPSESAAAMARKLGYKVHTGPIETAPDDYTGMDLVAMWVVIEHLSDPVHVFKKIHGCLKDDGWLCVSTHNIGSFLFKKFKENYYDNHIPNHLYHFSASTLQQFLERNGYEVIKIIHNRVLQSLLGSIAFKRMAKNPQDIWAKRLLNLNFKTIALFFPITYVLSLLGQTGRMTVWARKKKI